MALHHRGQLAQTGECLLVNQAIRTRLSRWDFFYAVVEKCATSISLNFSNNFRRGTIFEKLSPGFNRIIRKIFCFLAKFSVFRRSVHIFHVVILSKIYLNNSQESAPASCTKKSAYSQHPKSERSDFERR